MADRFWVGGTNSWNATAGTKWSTTDGGSGGAAVPTSSDNVFFTAASGAVTITISATGNCANFDTTGFTGAFTGTSILNIFGTLTLNAGSTISYSGTFTLADTSGIQRIITTNGQSLAAAFTFNGVGGSWKLGDSLTSSGRFTWTNGTFDDGGKNITNSAVGVSFSWGVGTKTINKTGVWKHTGTGNGFQWNTSSSGGTLNDTSGLMWISDTSATTKSFGGGGFTFYDLQIDGAAGAAIVTITQSNNFHQIFLQPDSSVAFTSSTTTTLSNAPYWVGSSGHLINITAVTAGTFATLAYSGAQITACEFLSLKDNHASGSTPFYAGANSTNVSGNLNWTFTQPTATANKFTACIENSPIRRLTPPESSIQMPPQTGVTPTPTPTWASGLISVSPVEFVAYRPESAVTELIQYEDVTPTAPLIAAAVFQSETMPAQYRPDSQITLNPFNYPEPVWAAAITETPSQYPSARPDSSFDYDPFNYPEPVWASATVQTPPPLPLPFPRSEIADAAMEENADPIWAAIAIEALQVYPLPLPRSSIPSGIDANVDPIWASTCLSTPQQPMAYRPDTLVTAPGSSPTEPIWAAGMVTNRPVFRSTKQAAPFIFIINPLGQIKIWNGTAWVAKPVKVWTGSAWVQKPLKYWDGTHWTITPY